MSEFPPDNRPDGLRWQDNTDNTEARRTPVYLAIGGVALMVLAGWFLLHDEATSGGFVLILALILLFTAAAFYQGVRGRAGRPETLDPDATASSAELFRSEEIPTATSESTEGTLGPTGSRPLTRSPADIGEARHVNLPIGGGEAGHEAAADLLGLTDHEDEPDDDRAEADSND